MAFTKQGILAKIHSAKNKKRQLEEAKALGWTEGDPYSAKEIIELHDKHCLLIRDHHHNYAPGGAFWQRMQGHVADLSCAPVIRMVDDAFDEVPAKSESDFLELMNRIGARMAIAIRDNDAELFFQLHEVLKCRRDGKDLSELKPKDLALQLKPGRKPSVYDLSRVFPLALVSVIGVRLRGYSPIEQLSKERISRAEITKEVNKFGATISEGELSRWINKFDFAPFMAEQPIARKRPKKED